MCEFFVAADPIFYESRTRTVRIRGVSTSIRMENFIWDTLARLAAEEGVTTNTLIVQFHDEILRHRGDVLNFTSFLLTVEIIATVCHKFFLNIFLKSKDYHSLTKNNFIIVGCMVLKKFNV